MAKKSKKEIQQLHRAMVDLYAFMSRPQRDDTVLRASGVTLDRALYPLIIGIAYFGPIGVVDLAEHAGRDYTTVSRQVTKLENLGLIKRRPGKKDRRINEAVITPAGKVVINALASARERIAEKMFQNWSDEDFSALVRLMRCFVDELEGFAGKASRQDTTSVP